MPAVRALGRSVTLAVLGLARIVLPAFGVVPPEWLMTAGHDQLSARRSPTDPHPPDHHTKT